LMLMPLSLSLVGMTSLFNSFQLFNLSGRFGLFALNWDKIRS
jgi:hypothetical protein